MCLPISHWNSSCHKLSELLICHAVQKVKLFNFHLISPHFTEKHLAALQERTMCKLRILHIQNLICMAPLNLFSKCVFYITVLPRRSALIITSLKQTACTHWKKKNPTQTTRASCLALWSSPAPTFQCVQRK